MRLATIRDGNGLVPAVVRGERILPLEGDWRDRGRLSAVASRGAGTDHPPSTRAELRALAAAADAARDDAWRDLGEVALGPAVPEPGAIYTIGLNYRSRAEPTGPPGPAITEDRGSAAPGRPLVYAKLPTSVAGSGATLTWDRRLTTRVDAECELGVVIGRPAFRVDTGDAMAHVFGYTIVDDVSSRDEWLDGDQWLLGKSMPGFCPVGPWVITADELDPRDLGLGCRINGEPIQDGRTSGMRHSIPMLISYLSQHVELRPGDLVVTGTPPRLDGPPGPDRHLEPGDVVAAWIEGIGELTTVVA